MVGNVTNVFTATLAGLELLEIGWIITLHVVNVIPRKTAGFVCDRTGKTNSSYSAPAAKSLFCLDDCKNNY